VVILIRKSELETLVAVSQNEEHEEKGGEIDDASKEMKTNRPLGMRGYKHQF
jgi:hypothetical protein